ncbi:MAG: alpha-L-fucosidase [Bacteroidales bacterium]|jgi:alpha-L-fucosidase|nr:alpha-L-fucosidase [Bacteroidales bacterium]
MSLQLKTVIIISLLGIASCTLNRVDEEGPYYVKKVDLPAGLSLDEKLQMAARVVPDSQQLAWQKLEMTAFIHFTINTFTGLEWGEGDESPELFMPSEFDARQWARIISEAGMKMIILTCKHHDGFCLWPTRTTDHSVKYSRWRGGKGDVVREVKEACDEYGLKFGVYLSPWDRNAESYGNSPEYNSFFMEQLKELLTWYGKVDEVWFDGACGEGPNGKVQVYDWDAYYRLIDRYQPEAVTAIMGEDIRWVGTESGYGRETEWSVTAFAPGGSEESKRINEKLGLNAMSEDLGSAEIINKAGKLFWYPAEVDVSIRPGWFYHPEEDDKVKSLEKLFDIYINSVGRNAVLLLNIPPDKRGLIHEKDEQRLKEFKAYLDRTFERNIAFRAFTRYPGARKSVDGKEDTYTHIDDLPAEIEYKFPFAEDFNVFMIKEFISKGQRIEQFKLEAFVNDEWLELASSTTVGYKKLLLFPTVKSDRIKLTVSQSRDNAMISEIGLFLEPDTILP